MRRTVFHCVLMQIVAAASGCAGPDFALTAVAPDDDPGGSPARGWPYDSNGDGRADFRILPGPDGRADTLVYGEGDAEEVIRLADIPAEEKRHLVLILDGVGYDLFREFHQAGHLRYLYPPSKVVAPYPTLTDLCLNDALATGRSGGFEAEYYDAEANKLLGGSWAYLRGANMPYNARLDYRADLITDALSYLFPWHEFKVELWSLDQRYNPAAPAEREYLAYFVSLAGLGTRNGAEGHQRALTMLDRYVAEVLWRSRGRVAVTVMSDHGHSYTGAQRVPLEAHLEAKGWRIRKRLDDARDVVYVRFGLETYASFATKRPAALAGDLISAEGVEIASYNEGDHVVVLAPRDQTALVRRVGGRYDYEVVSGDPLELLPALSSLTADEDGTYNADELLAATVDREYPAPLQRLWRAHRGDLAAHTPDVIVSLDNAWYSGAKGFAGAVEVQSTHGGLNRANSVTFIASSLGELPPVLRSRDIPATMARLLDARAWPINRQQSDTAP
ncbi:MAG: hypothetical protein GVY16_04555 [Planctomycetes bacterium]|jgi:hypothetical protein|nr:hypothetical protein [Phycisphaerae bacterium]NBB94993.1 hypothetical protein [Planctomycetota bacterium]